MTTGMSAPPIGMMSRTPSASDVEGDEPEAQRRLGGVEERDQEHERDAEPAVDEVALGQQDRRAGHPAVELEEGDDRAGEGDRADRKPERHLDRARGMNDVAFFDAEGLGGVKGACGDEHRGQADQRMEHRDELRHRRHLDGAGAPGADAAADREAEDDQQPRKPARRRTQRQRRHHRDRHADHAEAIALTRGGGRGEPAQRQDEQDAGDEIEQGGEIGVHRRQPFFLYIASMRSVTGSRRIC